MMKDHMKTFYVTVLFNTASCPLQLCSVGIQGSQLRAGVRTEDSLTFPLCSSPAFHLWYWSVPHGGTVSMMEPGVGPSHLV